MNIFVVIWIALTISLFDCFQTFTEMNEWATRNDLFRDQETRRRVVLIEAIGVNLIGLILAILMIPLLLSYFNAFDGQGKVANPNAFFYMALIIALIYIIGLPLKMYGYWDPQYNSVNGVIRSLSTAIQILILLFITLAFGYDPTLGTGNTDLAKFGLFFQITGVLCILCLITGIIFWKLFDITPEKAILIKEKLLELGR